MTVLEPRPVVPAQARIVAPAKTSPLPAFTVVVPTRNEAGNVVPLVRALETSLAGQPANVLFVDDSSDATPDVVRHVARTAKLPVTVIHREEADRVAGLGGAVTLALSRVTTPYVVVMDGDLQHPPELVPRLVSVAVAHQADVVVASRYTSSGEAGGLASTSRVAVSTGATRLTRLAFPRRLRGVSDPMSGFFAVRVAALAGYTLKPRGFKILMEILLRGAPLSVAEVPFSFGTRFSGASKATITEGWRFLRLLAGLRLHAWLRGGSGRVVRFAAVGVTGIAVNAAAFAAIVAGGAHYVVAAVAATQFSTLWNFVWTDRLVFPGSKRLPWPRRLIPFAAINEALLLGRVPLLVVLVHTTGLSTPLLNVVTLVVAFFGRYLASARLFSRQER